MDDPIQTYDPDDPRLLRALVGYLFNAWEEAIHSRDSALQALQVVPEWKNRYQEALANPDRVQYTTGKFAVAQSLFQSVLDGTVTRSQIESILELFSKRPN
jgi:hypothetical protein